MRRCWKIGLACLLLSCTDAALQPTEPEIPQGVDDRLRIRGEFCVQPDAEVVFPVKVLFILDQSASLQCTDSRNRRFPALNGLIDTLYGSPAVLIGFIGFSSWVRTVEFTNSRAALAPFLDPAAGLGTATDYQGAMAIAIRTLEQDMLNSDPAERARTRYVVVFLSDGIPEPRCNQGCEDDQLMCADAGDNDGDGLIDGSDPDCASIGDNSLHPDNLYGLCNADLSMLEEPIPDDEYVEFNGICPEYNQPEGIMQRVTDLLALQDLYSAGGVTLHTVLFFSPQAVVESVCPGAGRTFGYVEDEARVLLQAMARSGNGTFRDANLATDDDSFLQFDFRSLDSPQSLSSLMALNQHARLGVNDLGPDTDIDGLADDVELAAGTDPKVRDTDGDGYGDLFETRLAGSGFDPVDPAIPAVPCSDASDLDGDGLLGCEEAFLETDRRHPDTDGDRMLDWIELVLGTDPTLDDAMSDLDFDGNLNREEVLAGTDPTTSDQALFREGRIRYGLEDLGIRDVMSFTSGDVARRHCYRYDVQDLRLVATPLLPPDRGLNRILIYAQEQPAMLGGARSITSVACFEAFYLGESLKNPESGVIDVTEEAWNGLLGSVQTQIDGLLSCNWFDAASFNRSSITTAIDDCLPDAIQLGRFEFSEDTLIDLLRKYVATNTAVNLPQPASELFVPIEIYNPDVDCYRPWELDRLELLLQLIGETCNACATWDGVGDPPSPCCTP